MTYRLALFFILLMGVFGMTGSTSSFAGQTQKVYFAGGCFWCMESEFESKDGVLAVTSGYAGEGAKPSYDDVSTGTTGFLEAVEIEYDPSKVGYQDLLDIFWSNVDPFDDKGQFCDKGSQYRAAILYATNDEEDMARASLQEIESKYKKSVATLIEPLKSFYAAEDYHQGYYKTNALRYKLYRQGCGRDARLQELDDMKK